MIIIEKNIFYKNKIINCTFYKILFLLIFILYILKYYERLIKKFELKNNLIIKRLKEKNNNNNKLIKFLDFNKLILLERKKLIEYISKTVDKNISIVKSIFLGKKFQFGNQLITIYKTIFYCQILECRKIILDKNLYWFLKNKIINKKYRMAIQIKNRNEINKYDTFIDKTDNFFFYNKYIEPKFRINLLRKEIIKNLPKIQINYNDLYIYIRSGDIFVKPYTGYRQPPFCFYKNVLNNYEFKHVYLIAVDKNNPVINKLLKNFPNIIYNFNSLKIDISYLVYAYNIVGGASSTFLSNIIKLNNNLYFLWTFKYKSYSYNHYLKFNIISFYNINKIKIFLMYASNNYTKIMSIWKNTIVQRDLMINDNCPNPFVLIKN